MCAVGYIITLFSSKSYVKSWGSVKIFLEGSSPPPPVVAPTTNYSIVIISVETLRRLENIAEVAREMSIVFKALSRCLHPAASDVL